MSSARSCDDVHLPSFATGRCNGLSGPSPCAAWRHDRVFYALTELACDFSHRPGEGRCRRSLRKPFPSCREMHPVSGWLVLWVSLIGYVVSGVEVLLVDQLWDGSLLGMTLFGHSRMWIASWFPPTLFSAQSPSMFPAVWPTLSSIAPPTLFAIVSRFRPRVSKFVSHLVSQLCVHLFCNTPALCLPPCPQLASQLVCCCVARFVFHCVPPVSPTLFSRVSLPLSSSVPLPLCRPACFPLCLLLCLPSCFHFVSDCIFCLVSGLSPSLVLTVWHCACHFVSSHFVFRLVSQHAYRCVARFVSQYVSHFVSHTVCLPLCISQLRFVSHLVRRSVSHFVLHLVPICFPTSGRRGWCRDFASLPHAWGTVCGTLEPRLCVKPTKI